MKKKKKGSETTYVMVFVCRNCEQEFKKAIGKGIPACSASTACPYCWVPDNIASIRRPRCGDDDLPWSKI